LLQLASRAAMALQGQVKSFGPDKGFGFIINPDGSGPDIFLPLKACVDGKVPQKGDMVSFDVSESELKPGQLQASNVSGGTSVPKTAGPPGAQSGAVKRFDLEKGFGFITGPDGTDVFLHRNAMVDGSIPQEGDYVTYDVDASKSKPGQFVASNVQGGTGAKRPNYTPNGKDGGGKGKDKGYGGGDGGWGGGYGAAPSWDAGNSGPYGKGGKDDGKGMQGGKGGGGNMARMMEMMASWGGAASWGGGGGDAWGTGGGAAAPSWGGDASWGKGKW